MKHAFLITAHTYFKQLDDIISLMESPSHYFFVNIDKKYAGGGNSRRFVRRNIGMFSSLKEKSEWKSLMAVIHR